MFESAKKEIERLKASRPGRRFQERHKRAKEGNASTAARVLRVGAGLGVAAVGVILMPAPGPGWLIFILGLALVGSDIGFVARGLDWFELKARAVWEWIRSFWKSASIPLRVVVSLGLAAVAVGGGYGLYRVFIR